MPNFNERLAALMEESGDTAYSLAKSTELSETTIGRLLKGQNDPSAGTLQVLSEYFKVNTEWLETGTGEQSRSLPVSQDSLTIGARLEVFFKKFKINPAILMPKIGYSRQVYYNIVKKNANPSADFIAKILTEYPNLNANWLLKGSGEMLKVDDSPIDTSDIPKEIMPILTRLVMYTVNEETEQFVAAGTPVSTILSEGLRSLKASFSVYGGLFSELFTKKSLLSHEDLIKIVVDALLKNYPHISREWLLYGIGEPLIDQNHYKSLAKNNEDGSVVLENLDRIYLELIKRDGGTEFRRIGDDDILIISPLVSQIPPKRYFDKLSESGFLNSLPKHSLVTNKLYLGTYCSFVVADGSIAATDPYELKAGMIVTGRRFEKKLSDRKMDTIEGTQCVLVLLDRIIFTTISEWDSYESSLTCLNPITGESDLVLYDSDILEIYEIHAVTQYKV
ncbi:helix-turn-helix domain-containing protein [Dyadobacter sp. CY327]|uniref:helix-turn-helix domain-containing protein n=1 Tax=Dyadobacter sp. CY327 TaxID=2907301 RepID=UPI001F217D70|nr:helix-turn-helix transcriptional regulator [Dyadobacter sp. CY327]MCE7072014.1 helix-turn-helix domain-containing protein [Dyadobacter sp. CY327]